MSMMNKCAKFHKDSPSGKKVKFNLLSAIELLETADFVYNFFYRNPMQASNFGSAFDQLFCWIFLWNFHTRCLSTSPIPWCKIVKNDQKSKSRGSCLNLCFRSLVARLALFERVGTKSAIFLATETVNSLRILVNSSPIVRIFGKGKCNLSPILARQRWHYFRLSLSLSLSLFLSLSLYLSLSLCISLSLPPSTPHAKLIPKTIGNRKKRLCVRLRSRDKHHLRKSADRKGQISPVSGTNAFLICAFRSTDFLWWCLFPDCNLTHNLFFLFPLVSGINLIHFFDEKKDGGAGNSIVFFFCASIPCHAIWQK